MGIQALANVLCRVGVGEQKFHCVKACLSGQRKAVQKCNLVEQHGEVGSKTGHGGLQWRARTRATNAMLAVMRNSLLSQMGDVWRERRC